MVGSIDKKSVVVVEDDPAIRDLVTQALAPYFLVHAFPDNQQAWERLPCLPRPAVLVLDVMTPGLDGWTLARKLKTSPFAGIPIVFVTARSSASDVAEGIGAGARALITKPFKIASLVEKIGRIAGVVVPAAAHPPLTSRPSFRPSPPRTVRRAE